MRKIFFLALFFIIYLTKFNIAHSISPDVFIQSTVNRASQILSKNISKASGGNYYHQKIVKRQILSL